MIAQQPAKTHINLTIYPSKSDVIDSFRSLSLFSGRRSDGSSEITALAVLAIRIAFVPRLISLEVQAEICRPPSLHFSYATCATLLAYQSPNIAMAVALKGLTRRQQARAKYIICERV
jgi:hypothetical protein